MRACSRSSTGSQPAWVSAHHSADSCRHRRSGVEPSGPVGGDGAPGHPAAALEEGAERAGVLDGARRRAGSDRICGPGLQHDAPVGRAAAVEAGDGVGLEGGQRARHEVDRAVRVEREAGVHGRRGRARRRTPRAAPSGAVSWAAATQGAGPGRARRRRRPRRRGRPGRRRRARAMPSVTGPVSCSLIGAARGRPPRRGRPAGRRTARRRCRRW